MIHVICFYRNLLGNKFDLLSDSDDGNDDDCFVPTKTDLQSSSDEEEEAKIDSEDELIVKKRRGSRTLRSTEKTRVSARTPQKTPSKKVQRSRFLLCLPASSKCAITKPNLYFRWR